MERLNNKFKANILYPSDNEDPNRYSLFYQGLRSFISTLYSL